MTLLIKNIKGLVQVRRQPVFRLQGKEMGELPVLNNAYLLLKGDSIQDFGEMKNCPESTDQEIDASGRFVFPSFVDSHTHLVFAASREEEFVDKIRGMSYAEIAAKGGGILNSAKKLQKMTEDELFEGSLVRAHEIMRFGTGAVEIKSGYGLTLEDELKMLRVARRIGVETPLTVKTTFLGAHAVPKEHTKKSYMKMVLDEMIPAVAEEGLAEFIDAFCEEGFFSPEETEEIMERGKAFGLIPKIHANQLNRSGGVQVGVKTGALSVDHLETMGQEEIDALKGSDTMPTALPGAAFYLDMSYPPARKMINEGLGLALATDYNPGSAPCGRMDFMLSLACIKMKMTPEEAINAATINSAYALQLDDKHGAIRKGGIANLFITKPIPSYAFMPYSFGANLIETAMLQGRILE